MDLTQIITAISSIGVPAAIAFYVLIVLNKTLADVSDKLQQLIDLLKPK